MAYLAGIKEFSMTWWASVNRDRPPDKQLSDIDLGSSVFCGSLPVGTMARLLTQVISNARTDLKMCAALSAVPQ